MWEILKDAFLGAVLVSGLVIVMMMMVECLNIGTSGRFFSKVKSSRAGQVAVSALLGSIPGCMGGFASVSLYSHGMLSFGALVAMLIASSGDEAFAMLAMFPKKSLWIFLWLFVIAFAVGMAVDFLDGRLHFAPKKAGKCDELPLHEEDGVHEHDHRKHFSWKRFALAAGTILFAAALGFGLLEHEHGEEAHATVLTLLDERWMNILFAVLSIGLAAVVIFASDHLVEEHLFDHVVKKHGLSIFLWTFGTLTALGFVLQSVDISSWIGDNVALMILLAAAIGIIPESGPHLVFVTLFAAGVVPLPVLLASCISQDGHASLPLLAGSRPAFVLAKAINFAVALAAGYLCLLV